MNDRLDEGALVGDRFSVLNLAGSGGMGSVYRAVDTSTGSVVALKLLGLAASADHARFQREAEILSAMSHSAIVRYVAHGLGDGAQAYLAMEWVDGEDLGKRLSREVLSERETLVLGAQIAEALDAACSAGVVHRDVKPSNILLRDGSPDAPCLVDFGVARALDRSTAMTGTGVAIGTPFYMAPEQVSASKLLDGAADVFALACVLYECLTASSAFAGDSLPAVLARILFSAPAPLPAGLEGSDLDALMRRMFEKEPRQRPSAREVALELRRIATGHTTPRVPLPIGDAELRMTTMWFARAPDAGLAATVALDQATLSQHATNLAFGIEVVSFADGTLSGRSRLGNAHDQARAVVRSARRFKASLVDVTMVVTTGRATTRGLFPADDAIDRATSMLNGQSGANVVRLDDATAELLTDASRIQRDAEGPFLLADIDDDGFAPAAKRPRRHLRLRRPLDAGVLPRRFGGQPEVGPGPGNEERAQTREHHVSQRR